MDRQGMDGLLEGWLAGWMDRPVVQRQYMVSATLPLILLFFVVQSLLMQWLIKRGSVPGQTMSYRMQGIFGPSVHL